MNTEQTPVKEDLTTESTTFDLEWAKRGGVVKVLETPFLAKLLDASGDWATFHTVGSYNNSNFKFSASIYPNDIDGWLYAVERMATRAECDAAGVEYIEPPVSAEELAELRKDSERLWLLTELEDSVFDRIMSESESLEDLREALDVELLAMKGGA